jgi:hypothetical protein
MKPILHGQRGPAFLDSLRVELGDSIYQFVWIQVRLIFYACVSLSRMAGNPLSCLV